MWFRLSGIVLIAIIALLAFGYREARADPEFRQVAIALPDWPRGAAPVTVALISDIHMESAAMDAEHLRRIVALVNARKPDLILLAGDFVEGRGTQRAAEAVPILAAVLPGFKARLGIVAVLGNHDYWTDWPAVDAMLKQAGIRVLHNAAVVRGPLAIGGLDDSPTGHDRLARTVSAIVP